MNAPKSSLLGVSQSCTIGVEAPSSAPASRKERARAPPLTSFVSPTRTQAEKSAKAGKSGKLGEDLSYRPHVFSAELPPLRQRKEDLPLLIQSFITEFNTRNGKHVSAVEPAGMKVLEQ